MATTAVLDLDGSGEVWPLGTDHGTRSERRSNYWYSTRYFVQANRKRQPLLDEQRLSGARAALGLADWSDNTSAGQGSRSAARIG